jgi:small-conductance mechanosensitive channel
MTATILQGGGLPLGPDELVQHYGSLLVELGEALAPGVLAFVVLYAFGRLVLVRVARGLLDWRAVRPALARFGALVVDGLSFVLALAVAVDVTGLARPLLAFARDLTEFGALVLAVGGVLAALVLAVGLASRDLLANVVAGLVILSAESFGPGDRLRWNGYAGTVAAVGLRSTRFDAADNESLTVPNRHLTEAVVVSPLHVDRVEVVVDVGVDDDASLPQTRSMLTDVATGLDGVLSDPAPTVNLHGVVDDVPVVQTRFWIDPRSRSSAGAGEAFLGAVRQEFAASEVELEPQHTGVVGNARATGEGGRNSTAGSDEYVGTGRNVDPNARVGANENRNAGVDANANTNTNSNANANSNSNSNSNSNDNSNSNENSNSDSNSNSNANSNESSNANSNSNSNSDDNSNSNSDSNSDSNSNSNSDSGSVSDPHGDSSAASDPGAPEPSSPTTDAATGSDEPADAMANASASRTGVEPGATDPGTAGESQGAAGAATDANAGAGGSDGTDAASAGATDQPAGDANATGGGPAADDAGAADAGATPDGQADEGPTGPDDPGSASPDDAAAPGDSAPVDDAGVTGSGSGASPDVNTGPGGTGGPAPEDTSREDDAGGEPKWYENFDPATDAGPKDSKKRTGGSGE